MAVHPVLAHALGIPAAPAEVGLGVLAERGPAQQDRRSPSPGCRRAVSKTIRPALGVDARHHGPRGRQRVDLPDAAPLRRRSRCRRRGWPGGSGRLARSLEGILEGLAVARGSSRAARDRPSASDDAGHPLEDVVEEEAEPDALAPALAADLVEPVVPVAGPDQREPVGAHPPVEHEVDRLQAVPVDGVLAGRSQRVEPHPVLAGRQGLERLLRLQVGRPLVEERIVAGRRDVLDHGPGAARGGCPRRASAPTKPVRPSWRRWNQWTTSPSRNCCEACRRICRRASDGVHPDQVHRVLELVAEAEGAAGLVEAAPRPDPLGERLVLQPVQVAIELRARSVWTWTVSIRLEPPSPGLFEAGPSGVGIPILADDRLGPVAVVGLTQDHDDRAARRRAGISSVVQERGDRPVVVAVVERPARRVPPGTGWATLRPAPKKRPRSVSTRSAAAGHGDEGRPGAERVPRVLEEERRRATGRARILSGPEYSGWPASTIWK